MAHSGRCRAFGGFAATISIVACGSTVIVDDPGTGGTAGAAGTTGVAGRGAAGTTSTGGSAGTSGVGGSGVGGTSGTAGGGGVSGAGAGGTGGLAGVGGSGASGGTTVDAGGGTGGSSDASGPPDASADAPSDTSGDVFDAPTCEGGQAFIAGACRLPCSVQADCAGDVCVGGHCLPTPLTCAGCPGGPCPSSQVCRPAQGNCDLPEFCDGTTPSCPADSVATGGICRTGSGDACDPDERCDGITKVCPSDSVAPTGTTCRTSANACDPDETCSGIAGETCPPDVSSTTCPGATACSGGECVLPGGHKLAFFSSQFWDKQQSGVAAGDQLCQAGADAALLAGTFVALLSTSTVDARDRIPDRAYHRLDDALIASSHADLFDGSIANPISIEETGVSRPGSAAMTGSNPDGTAHADTCADWTDFTAAADYRFGGSGLITAGWISNVSSSCQFPGWLYCFQVD